MTIDGGVSFIPQYNCATHVYIEDIYFLSGQIGWAVGQKSSINNYFIIHTENGGETWDEQTIAGTPKPTILGCVYFVNDSIGWIGGGGLPLDHGAIYFTYNGGEDWQLQQEFYEPVWDIQMLNRDTGWAVGADYIYHTTNGDTIIINDMNENKIAKDFFAIFPNPTNGIFMIKIPHSSTGNCQILISDLYGDLVFHLSKITIEQLNNRTIDLSNYPTGIYYITVNYTINGLTDSFTKKIIKL